MMRQPLALLFPLLFAALLFPAAPRDSVNLDDRNSARRDLNILLGLPEDIHLIKPLAASDSLGPDQYAAFHKKGVALYEQGIRLYKAGEYDKAREVFVQAVTLLPLSRNAYGYLLKTLHTIRKIKDPDTELRKIEEALAASADTLFQAGFALYAKQDYDGAIKAWKKVTASAPGYAKAFDYIRKAEDKIDEVAENFLQQGLYFQDKGSLERAIAEWEKGLAACPENEKLKVQLDISRMQLKGRLEQILKASDEKVRAGRYAEAARILSDGLEKNPESAILKEKLRLLRQSADKAASEGLSAARALFDKGNYAEAVRKTDDLLAADPDHTAARELKVRISDKVRLEQEQEWLDGLFKEGQAALDKGNYAEALDKFAAIERERPGYPALKERRKAALEGQSAIENRKRSAVAFNRGLELFNVGQYLGASKEWKEILREDPKNEMVQNFLWEAERRAKESTEQQRERAAREGEVLKLSQTAQENVRKKKYADALRAYEKAAATDPDNHTVRKGLKNTRRELVKEQEKATPETAKKIDRLFMQGIGLYREGQYRKAVDCWKQVVALAPDHKKAQTYIANVTQKLQKIETL